MKDIPISTWPNMIDKYLCFYIQAETRANILKIISWNSLSGTFLNIVNKKNILLSATAPVLRPIPFLQEKETGRG